MPDSAPELSIVIPIHNEAASIVEVVQAVRTALLPQMPRYEIILVDDGSSDGTSAVARNLSGERDDIVYVSLPLQFGQSAALWAGLQLSRGQVIATMDGDGQQSPHDIPRLLEHLTDDVDAVLGVRQVRRDPWEKRFFSRVANRVRRLITQSTLIDSGCSVRAFHRRLLEDLYPFAGLHRFIPTMFEMAGRRIVSVPISHQPRDAGTSHYGITDRALVSTIDCLMLRWLGLRRLPTATITSTLRLGEEDVVVEKSLPWVAAPLRQPSTGLDPEPLPARRR